MNELLTAAVSILRNEGRGEEALAVLALWERCDQKDQQIEQIRGLLTATFQELNEVVDELEQLKLTNLSPNPQP